MCVVEAKEEGRRAASRAASRFARDGTIRLIMAVDAKCFFYSVCFCYFRGAILGWLVRFDEFRVG